MAITFFVKENIYNLGILQSGNFIEIIEYKDSEVDDKRILFLDKNVKLKDFGQKIKSLIKDASYILDNDRVKVFFENFHSEDRFEELLKTVIDKLPKNDVRRYDINDIIDKAEMQLLRKVYFLIQLISKLY